MKKILIPMLLIVIAFAGCKKEKLGDDKILGLINEDSTYYIYEESDYQNDTTYLFYDYGRKSKVMVNGDSLRVWFNVDTATLCFVSGYFISNRGSNFYPQPLGTRQLTNYSVEDGKLYISYYHPYYHLQEHIQFTAMQNGGFIELKSIDGRVLFKLQER